MRENVAPAQEAITKGDFETAKAKLVAADAAAQTNDRQVRHRHHQDQSRREDHHDNPYIAAAIDQVINSGSAPAADLPTLYQNQGALAVQGQGRRPKAGGRL